MRTLFVTALCSLLALGCARIDVQPAEMEDGEEKEKFSFKGRISPDMEIGIGKSKFLYLEQRF